MEIVALLILVIFQLTEGQQIIDGGQVKWAPYDGDDGRCQNVAFYDHLTTWCTSRNNQVFVQKKGQWLLVSGLKLKQISIGGAGVWGLDLNGKAHFRQGVSDQKPEGIKWTGIDGTFSHISSGPTGVLWGVSYPSQNALYRSSITCDNPLGRKWEVVENDKRARHVSCSKLGCWVVSTTNTVHFVSDVKSTGDRGPWRDIPTNEVSGFLRSVDSSASGYRIVGVSFTGQLYMRKGISLKTPHGREWVQLGNESYHHAVPCHMGYIATTTDDRVRFVTRVPLCKKTFDKLQTIDTGKDDSTCGVYKDVVYQKQGNEWIEMDGHMRHVSCTNHELWGVNRYHNVFMRTGVSCSNPFGSDWMQVPGELKQIDVAYFGLVYGITPNDEVRCRAGITRKNPIGKSWIEVPGRMKYVSCGDLGCWSVNQIGTVFFRGGVSNDDCAGPAGTEWKKVPGAKLKLVESGHHGLVFGVGLDNIAWMRMGTSEMNPVGTGWMPLYDKTKHITHGRLKILTTGVDDTPYYCI